MRVKDTEIGDIIVVNSDSNHATEMAVYQVIDKDTTYALCRPLEYDVESGICSAVSLLHKCIILNKNKVDSWFSRARHGKIIR